jgi:hypothetical protein
LHLFLFLEKSLDVLGNERILVTGKTGKTGKITGKHAVCVYFNPYLLEIMPFL